jgi:hypothetical protein
MHSTPSHPSAPRNNSVFYHFIFFVSKVRIEVAALPSSAADLCRTEHSFNYTLLDESNKNREH